MSAFVELSLFFQNSSQFFKKVKNLKFWLGAQMGNKSAQDAINNVSSFAPHLIPPRAPMKKYMINVFNTTTKIFLILQRSTLFKFNNVYSTFLIITGIKAIYTKLRCSPFERRFEALTSRLRRALSAIIVRSWWAHLGKSCAHTALTSRSKIRNFQLKKSMRS